MPSRAWIQLRWRSVWRLALLVVGAWMLLALAFPAHSLADGDPGSDVLVGQNLFYEADLPISSAQELALGRLLDATASAGAPVRVALIAHPDDLGAISGLWRKPQQYALFLGDELSLTYTGRLLIVMPNGFGFYWHGHPAAPGYAALAGIKTPTGDTPSAMTAATEAAVHSLEQSAGVSAGALGAAARRASNTSPVAAPAPSSSAAVGAGAGRASARTAGAGGGGSGWIVALVLIAAISSLFWVPFLWRRRGRLRLLRRLPLRRYSAVGAGIGGLAVLVGLVVAIPQLEAGPSSASTLQNNPNLDPGTALPGNAAPNFTLVDETGHRVSLSQYRGKVVILSFIDAECQTICPLTTTAMLDAKRSLGAAASKVALLGVDANWRSTQIDDVLNYTELHGMTGHWHFLTGSLAQLQRVWSDYKLNEYGLLTKQERSRTNEIDHIAATFVIDPSGRMRTLYTTQSSYATIPQLGQLLAQEASRLLPSHPRVETHYSYAWVRGTPPTATAVLPRVGGRTITLGPGHPHVYVFFATWDQQTTPLVADLEQLNQYAQVARREGLPTPVAVDEGSVEPSPLALPSFLRTLPHPLSYPVAIDQRGQVADGYDVQGEPWFVLTRRSGRSAWYREVYTAGWPSNATLLSQVRAAVHSGSGVAPSVVATERELAGSPAPLNALHAQASRILSGGQSALDARIKALKGYPIVVNAWGSWCEPCQAEFHLFAKAAAQYGKRVAFLGADVNDSSTAGQQFLSQHHVSYPSYETTPQSMPALLPAGLEGTPTTIYISPSGGITYVNDGPYESQGSLDQAIRTYAER